MEDIGNKGEYENSLVQPYETLPLTIGMEFECEDDAYMYYNKYARLIGFSIRKEYVNKNKTYGYVTSRKLTCYKEGERGDDKRTLTVKKPRKETRTGCSAHIVISRQPNEKYQIVSFEATHNHPLVPKSCAHLLPSQRSIKGAQAFEINLADDSGINPKSAFDYASLQAGGRPNLGYTLTDHKNFLRTKRKFDLKNGEAGSLLEYFERRRMYDPMFQSAIDLDDDDMITNIFWADSQMILDYNNFGDVLSFDTTFRTNKDYRPLALFLGMNNHRQILIFGAALLYDETKTSFEWLFRTFLRIMSEKKPDTFITDQDSAIMHAVERVMPDTSHRLCIWHLGKNAFKNLNHLFTRNDSFPSEFGKLLHHYEYEDDFLHAWENMLDTYDLRENSWIQTTFNLREKWSKAYRKTRFSAGIRSTQLSESFNGSLRRYLKSDLDLMQFFKHFERAVNDKRHKELDAAYDMTQKLSVLKVDYPLLRHARNAYTSPIFDMFQKEWVKSLLVVVISWKEDESSFVYTVKACGSTREHVVTSKPSELYVSCTCELFSYLGILCSHSLKILDLMNLKLAVPSRYILKRWTKEATSVCEISAFKSDVEDDPTLKVTKRFRHLCPTFVQIANEASECDEGVQLAEKYVNELIIELRMLKARNHGVVLSDTDLMLERENLGDEKIRGGTVNYYKAKGIKKKEPTYRGKKRLKSFTEKLTNKKTYMKEKQINTHADQQPEALICQPEYLSNVSQVQLSLSWPNSTSICICNKLNFILIYFNLNRNQFLLLQLAIHLK